MNTYAFTFKFTDTAQGTVDSPDNIDAVREELLARYSQIDDFRDFDITIVSQDGAKVIDAEYTVIDTEVKEETEETRIIN
jgi:hypothetical protein